LEKKLACDPSPFSLQPSNDLPRFIAIYWTASFAIAYALMHLFSLRHKKKELQKKDREKILKQ